MLVQLYKLAYDLDREGLHSEAEEIEEVMKLMAKRVGLNVEDMVSLANYFDEVGDVELADTFDEMAKEAKDKFHAHKSKGDKKAPKGAMHKAPKAWFKEQLGKVMKSNPKYSKERAEKVVGDLWDNKLTDAKRKSIYERFKKHKDPNK